MKEKISRREFLKRLVKFTIALGAFTILPVKFFGWKKDKIKIKIGGKNMKRLSVYKCEICGNIVEVLNVGGGTLVCCGKPMTLLEEKTADAATEKHVPIMEEQNGKLKVKVGSVPHPMEEKHYIQWIEVITENDVYREFLKPGNEPAAYFPVKAKDVKILREYCNIHSLWKNEL